jgi:hypothetical protein
MRDVPEILQVAPAEPQLPMRPTRLSLPPASSTDTPTYTLAMSQDPRIRVTLTLNESKWIEPSMAAVASTGPISGTNQRKSTVRAAQSSCQLTHRLTALALHIGRRDAGVAVIEGQVVGEDLHPARVEIVQSA